MQNSKGAELYSQLKVLDPHPERKVFFAKKGTHADIDSYSPFFNTHRNTETELHNQLQAENITDLYICGLAFDVSIGMSNFKDILYIVRFRTIVMSVRPSVKNFLVIINYHKIKIKLKKFFFDDIDIIYHRININNSFFEV